MTKLAALMPPPSRPPIPAAMDAVEAAACCAALELDLAERVERALRATGYAPLRGVEVSANGRLVTLLGWVPSYYLKQVAQEAARAVPGVRELRNDLSVAQPR